MSRTIFRILFGLLVFLLVASILLAAFGLYSVRRSFPQVEGEIRLAGLDSPVEVYRDDFGVPHIFAASSHDLFFVQGYVHAQDRFWQMDFWRHIGSGRLAEMFGESQLETDQFLRTLGWARVVQKELETIDADHLAVLQAYADGVNAYLADHEGSAISLEYAILKLLNPEYRPEPWQPLHTLTWGKVMAWDLGDNMDSEIARAALLKTLTPEQVAELYPPYPAGHPYIVPGFQPGGSLSQLPSASALTTYSDFEAALASISKKVAGLEKLLGPSEKGIGSNNWSISGDLTATGLPILANDTHLGEQMPSIWYEVGLYCTQVSAECPYRVVGFSFAGVPGVVIGHNERIAWGVTNLGPDVQDLYIEKINPDNPNQYEVDGEWVDMELVQESIQVAGGETVQLPVHYTRHGPIISETYGGVEDFEQSPALEFPGRYAVALRWTALEPTELVRAIIGFDKAQNWEEFRQAARYFHIAAQNVVYADLDGNIGYQATGLIPMRADGDGLLPVRGWVDDYEWTGYIPFEELPFEFNPARGYVVSANNAVVDDTYPYLISREWDYGSRARRIVDLIENAPGPIDVAYVQKIHADNHNLIAEALTPMLLQIPLGDAHLEAARAILDGWDYQDHMDSAPSALFNVFWKYLLRNTFGDDLPEDYYPAGGSRYFEVMRKLAGQPNSPWWDNQNTPEVEDRDQILHSSFQAAVDELEATLGKKPESWAWGDLHMLTLHNQSLGYSGVAPIEALFNRGPFRVSGGSGIVNATWCHPDDYQVYGLPSQRMVVDLSDMKNSWTIHTTGQSGHAYHPNYVNMTDLWRAIQYHRMLWAPDQAESGIQARLRLAP
ncbi:MAG: penicillin acylase family protein [Anaerolineales bacterium]|nr:penicillin acylase family protein [Anaerolineales bacterium]